LNVFGRGFDSRRLHYFYDGQGRRNVKRKETLALLGAFFLLTAAGPSRARPLSGPGSQSRGPDVLVVSVRDLGGSSRVTLSSTVPLAYSFQKRTGALQVTFETPLIFRVRQAAFSGGFVKSVGWSQGYGGYAFTIELASEAFFYVPSVREDPFELSIDLGPAQTEAPGLAAAPARAAPEAAEGEVPTASVPLPGGQSVKFKTIVIDPGHGGIETGAKGKFGALEKDITLAIGLKLQAIIEKNLAFRVFMTRDKDMDVSLENRSALANNHKADLFISIHANGSPRKKSHGSETYFLSQNATDEEARRLAYLENTSGALEGRIEEDDKDDIKLILWDLAQASYLKQSSQLAERIQAGLNALLGTMNRGVKQAPFKVLTGAACPAVLVETAFISNPEEEKELGDGGFQDSVAQAIYLSLVEYLKLYP
jgi:N-acetylmuramoyl-L-alanine amidase